MKLYQKLTSLLVAAVMAAVLMPGCMAAPGDSVTTRINNALTQRTGAELLKGIAGTIPILIKGQAASRKSAVHKIPDDSLLVFDRHIVAIQFLVHRNARVARYGKAFDHSLSPFRYAAICRSNSEMYSASCFLRNSS